MSKKDEALKLALEALEQIAAYRPLTFAECSDAEAVMRIAENAIPYLQEALAEQPAQQQEPVAHSIVAGALFDFMGWLTSRNERLVLSSTENAAPAADAIKDFAHMRNLNIDDAKVRDWQEHLTSQPAQRQSPVAKVCHDLDGHIGWNPNLTELPAEGTELYTSPPAQQHDCSRSHPHENMDAMCKLRTEIARLTNENARLKAQQQEPLFWYDEEEGWLHDNYDDAPSGCIPLYTSPPASKPWVGLTDEEKSDLWCESTGRDCVNEDTHVFADSIEAKLKDKNGY